MTARSSGAYIPAGGLVGRPLVKPFRALVKRLAARPQPPRASALFGAVSVPGGDAWEHSEAGTEALARTLGMWPARAGESWAEFRARLLYALHGGHHG